MLKCDFFGSGESFFALLRKISLLLLRVDALAVDEPGSGDSSGVLPGDAVSSL